MVEKTRAWWSDLPAVEKWVRALIGLAILLYGGLLGLAAAVETPARLDAHDVRLEALESDMDQAKEDRRLLEFVACGLENKITGKPEAECLRYLTNLSRGDR